MLPTVFSPSLPKRACQARTRRVTYPHQQVAPDDSLRHLEQGNKHESMNRSCIPIDFVVFSLFIRRSEKEEDETGLENIIDILLHPKEYRNTEQYEICEHSFIYDIGLCNTT
jgi:hypothetical protein